MFKLNHITIYICFFITILFELTVAVLVSDKIEDERLYINIGRLFVQLVILIFTLNSTSKIGLYVLVFYHVLLALTFLSKGLSIDTISLIFGIYHVLIGLMLYFNEEIDEKLKVL